MKWMRERDALIAQTLAFVQSVGRSSTGEPPATVVPAPTPAAPAGNPLPTVTATVEATDTPLPPPRPLVPSDFQLELKARIASFRAHQERFNREREAYFSATLARLRAAIEDTKPSGPHESA